MTVRSDRRGHFQVEGSVDGRRLDFMVDTGASVVALRERDASKLGIFPTPRDYTGRVQHRERRRSRSRRCGSPRSRSTASASTTCSAVVIPDQALSDEPARHVVPVARAALRDGQRPSRDGTVRPRSFQLPATELCAQPFPAAELMAPRLFPLAIEDLMLPKPKPSLTPNTYAYESEPMVKPTGFREYDARWLFGKEINLMGVQALGLGLGTLIHELGVKPELVTGPRFPRLFGLDQDGADHRPDERRHQGEGHRARGDADGLFRAVRSRRAVRRDGDGLAQRQWLDRREDGREPPAHLRPRRDDAAEGDRARARRSSRRRAAPTSSSRISRRATSRISPTGRSSSAS